MSINKVILIGNVGKDPEIRDANGVKVASFSLATSERRRDSQGNPVENTEWHNIVAFGNTAEVCDNYVRKGGQVFIEGKIRTRSWQTQEGTTAYRTEIVVDRLELLGRRQDDSQAQAPAYGQYAQGQQYQQRPAQQAMPSAPTPRAVNRRPMPSAPVMPMPSDDMPMFP